MKKGLFVFAVGIVMVLMVACGRPQNMTEETYEYGKKALEIIQKYNSADISAEDAKSRLESIVTALDNLEIDDDLAEIKKDTVQIIVDGGVMDLQYGWNKMLDTENSLKEILGE